MADSEYRIQENIAAITSEIFINIGFVAQITARNNDNLSDVYAQIIDAAKAFERAAELFGNPNEDYDWVLAIQEFAKDIVEFEDVDVYQLAKQDIWKHREDQHKPNPNLNDAENRGEFDLDKAHHEQGKHHS